jgi:hypothetical protein
VRQQKGNLVRVPFRRYIAQSIMLNLEFEVLTSDGASIVSRPRRRACPRGNRFAVHRSPFTVWSSEFGVSGFGVRSSPFVLTPYFCLLSSLFRIHPRIPEIFHSISREMPGGTNQNGGLNTFAAAAAAPGATARNFCSRRIRLLSHQRAESFASRYS